MDKLAYEIIPTTMEHVEGFFFALDSVARELNYLGFLQAPPIAEVRKFVFEHIRDNWPHYVAISSENQVMGWCDISPLSRPIYAHAGVLGIGIMHGFRGQGIGDALMRAAIDQAKMKGLTRIELTVRENNANAIALYQKFGFLIEGLHHNAVRIGTVYQNTYTMALLLPEFAGLENQ